MRLKVLAAMMVGMFLAVAASAQLATPPDPDNILLLDLSSGGQVSILLRPDKAPKAVERIKVLARRGFYNGLTFHRVVEGFMAQGGDPKGDGTGGSDLPDLKAEFNDLPHVRGAMAMARAASEDSANSQFFLMLMPNLSLDNHYTVIGRVFSGMQYVDAIEKGEPPANPTRILKASIASGDQPAPAPIVAAAPAKPALSPKEQAKADKEAKRAMDQAIQQALQQVEQNRAEQEQAHHPQ